MGLFDYVNVEMPCPKCGTLLTNFQSKDEACRMRLIDPDTVRSFYTNCDNCKTWVEFAREATDIYSQDKPSLNREQVEALGFICISPRKPQDSEDDYLTT